MADLQEFEAERLDVTEYSVERRVVQLAGENGVSTLLARVHRGEREQHHGAEVAMNPDRVPGWRWIHEAMVGCHQVTSHHQDLVTVVPADSSRSSRARCTAEDRFRAWSLA